MLLPLTMWVQAAWYNAYQLPVSEPVKAQRMIDDHFRAFEEMGINRVFFLIKHPNGKVYYRSRYAPPACSWDPLDYVLREGREHGIEVHPYLNIFAEGEALLRQHPEMAEQKSNGTRLEWASPTFMGVRERMLNMIREVVEKYPVDGMQFDRLRYPDSPLAETGFHPASRSMFKSLYEREPSPRDSDFAQFKCDWITTFVEEAASAARSLRPWMKISCAVYPTPTIATRQAAQQWDRWLNVLDEIYPMTYTADLKRFNRYLKENSTAKGRARIVMGIAAYYPGMTPAKLERQVELCRTTPSVSGVCYFNGFNLISPDYFELVQRLHRPEAAKKASFIGPLM